MGDGYEISIKRLAKQKAEGRYPASMPKPKDRSMDPSGDITADEPDVYEETPKMAAIRKVWDTVNDMKKVPTEVKEMQDSEDAGPENAMSDADRRTKKRYNLSSVKAVR